MIEGLATANWLPANAGVRAAPPGPVWKPLNTIPTDGRNVLLYWPEVNVIHIGRCFADAWSYDYSDIQGVHGLEPRCWTDLPSPPEKGQF